MSVIKACIERFRHQAPLPEELRTSLLSKEDFWWRSKSNDGLSTPITDSIEATVEEEDSFREEGSQDSPRSYPPRPMTLDASISEETHISSVRRFDSMKWSYDCS